MRGSPLLRSLFIVLALLAAGAGLARVTSAKAVEKPAVREVVQKSESQEIHYRLTLSAPAEEIALNGKTGLSDSGTLPLDPANPSISIVIRWKTEPLQDGHRFARLTLEPPGQATFTHVFDADGDIDDFLELPLPAGK